MLLIKILSSGLVLVSFSYIFLICFWFLLPPCLLFWRYLCLKILGASDAKHLKLQKEPWLSVKSSPSWSFFYDFTCAKFKKFCGYTSVGLGVKLSPPFYSWWGSIGNPSLLDPYYFASRSQAAKSLWCPLWWSLGD